MPSLLFPAGLAALAALLAPLAIHLARRSVLLPVDFAAMRWLEAKRRPRSQWRLDEWLLLVLRLLLLTLVAVWLAHPALEGASDRTPWVVVIPGADLAHLPAGEGHWLAPNFPALDMPQPDGPLPIASLLREADAKLPPGASLTVVTPAIIEGADAERPRLSRAVTWRITGVAMPRAAAASPSIPRLTVRYAPSRAGAVRFLRAAVIAWTPPGRTPLFDARPATQPLGGNPGVIVWLGGQLPAEIIRRCTRGATVLVEDGAIPDRPVVWSDAAGHALITAAPLRRGRLLHLTRRLDPMVMSELLDPTFPSRLATVLGTSAATSARVEAADLAPVTGGPRYPQPARDLRPWLALVIAVTLIVERGVATGRRTRR